MKRLTSLEVIERSRSIHGDVYDYDRIGYINRKIPITVTCKIHGDFKLLAENHIRRQDGCYTCAQEKRLRDSWNDFVVKAKIVHGDRYNYEAGKTNFKFKARKLPIECKIHGIFLQTPASHVVGNGCRKCADAKMSSDRTYTTKEFEFLARARHGNKYDYLKVAYTHSREPVEIICSQHGSFYQEPVNHIRGNGCPECSHNKSLTQDEFLSQCIAVHGDRYDYSKVIFRSVRSKVEIICKIHGSFYQIASVHVVGSGCSSCTMRSAHMEDLWLTYMGIPKDSEHRQVSLWLNRGKFVRVDGYNPSTQAVYEFNGSFYHGDPAWVDADNENPLSKKKFGELFQLTINREQMLIDVGYNVVSEWESNLCGRLADSSEFDPIMEVVATNSEWIAAVYNSKKMHKYYTGVGK